MDWLISKKEVADAFKARAVALYLAPRVCFIPFAWKGADLTTTYASCKERIQLGKLSLSILSFALPFLEASIKLVVELERSGPYDLAYGDLGRLRADYNAYILQALKLPDTMGKANYLSLRYVPEVQCGHPFLALLKANIPEIHKYRGDLRVRRLIIKEAETRNHLMPASIFGWYVDWIQLCLPGEGRDRPLELPYSRRLLASQLDFVLSLPLEGRVIFFDNSVANIPTLLPGKEYRDLRHRFFRHIMLESHGRHAFNQFSATSRGQIAVCREAALEFGRADPNLGERLKEVIARGEERLRFLAEAEKRQKERVASVLAKMR